MKTRTPSPSPALGLLSELQGVVLGHRDGHGFVRSEQSDTDVYLPDHEMRTVLHGDQVVVRVQRFDHKGRPEGRVLHIVERPRHPIVGRLLKHDGAWVVMPEDQRYHQNILVPKLSRAHAIEWNNKVVVVTLTQPPVRNAQPVGEITEVLGDPDDAGMEIEIAVRKFDVPHAFSQACLQAAQALPKKVRVRDKKGRVDLTHLPLVTIDGEDARDFDDAVYAEPTLIRLGSPAAGESKTDTKAKATTKTKEKNRVQGQSEQGQEVKGWRLIVAIADVSHYVQTGEAIDVDAYERATSVYFPRRVIPMLPEKLSNGLCSLNPQVERLCMVCDMLVTQDGQLHSYEFYPAVIFSHARLTYTEVAAVLSRDPASAALAADASVPPDLQPALWHLHDVYRALFAARGRRGAIDFETVETQIICDDAGHIERIVARERNDAHRLIEEAMLAANVCAANFILRSQHLGLFRVHEGPTAEKKELLRRYLRAIGVKASLSDEPIPAEFQAIAEATKDRPDKVQIHTMLLRSMQQAIYTPVNNGHFGLAYQAYTHFTSPIRRYPDLLVHRVIKAILHRTTYHLPNLPKPTQAHAKLDQWMAKRKPAQAASSLARQAPAPKLTKQQLVEQESWKAAGLHCSACERRADEASRDVEQWLKCQYIQQYLGETFAGKVSSITSFGLFITLDDMYVEGLAHIAELGGDYYQFDEARQELRGERTGVRYGVGTPVMVQIAAVDLEARKVAFKLLRPAKAQEQGMGTAGQRPPRSSEREARGDQGANQAKAKTQTKDKTKAKAKEKTRDKTKASQPKTSSARPATTHPKPKKSRPR